MKKLNLFEGARRLVLLLQATGILLILVLHWFNTPYLNHTYITKSPSDSFHLTDQDNACDIGTDAIEYTEHLINGDEKINIRLCFKSMDFDNGKFIPFKIDTNGMIWGKSPYDRDVMRYTQERKEEFIIPVEDYSEFGERWWDEKLTNIWNGIKYSFYWLISLQLISLAVGWSVRGFMNIPSGSDYRIDPITKEH